MTLIVDASVATADLRLVKVVEGSTHQSLVILLGARVD